MLFERMMRRAVAPLAAASGAAAGAGLTAGAGAPGVGGSEFSVAQTPSSPAQPGQERAGGVGSEAQGGAGEVKLS